MFVQRLELAIRRSRIETCQFGVALLVITLDAGEDQVVQVLCSTVALGTNVIERKSVPFFTRYEILAKEAVPSMRLKSLLEGDLRTQRD